MYLRVYLIAAIIVTLCLESSGENVITTTTSCDTGWVLDDGRCYYWNNIDLVTYSQANDECRSRGSDLLVIHDNPEQNWVNIQTESYSTSGWWIGVQKHGSDWKWADGTVATNIKWNKEPDNYDTQDCVTINQFNRYSDDFCRRKYPYICKYPKKEAEYCPTVSKDARWAYLIYACYWIADPANSEDYLSWSDALTKCKTLNPLGTGTMDLLSVTSGMEIEFFSSELPYRSAGVSTPWWTGLNDQKAEDFYVWQDGSKWNISLTLWDNAPSNGSDENCAIMYTAGVVDDYKCLGRSHFICSKSASKNHLNLGCPNHWLRGGKSCYLFGNTSQVTWSDARSICLKGGGDLLKVDSMDENYWLSHQYIGSGDYWTGLNDQTTEGDYRWTDGTVLNKKYISWDKEPSNGVGEVCTYLTNDGTFIDSICLAHLGFICEYTTDPGDKCIPGWVSDGNSGCYYFSPTNRTSVVLWTEVPEVCLDLTHAVDSDLQSGYLCIDSKDEQAFIKKQLALQPLTYKGWWTGLNSRSVAGMWVWQRSYDTKPDLNLITWSSEPNNYNNEDCTVIYQDGRYNDLNCNEKANYICEKSAGSKITILWFVSCLCVICLFIY